VRVSSLAHQAHQTDRSYRPNEMAGSHPPASQGGVAGHVQPHTRADGTQGSLLAQPLGPPFPIGGNSPYAALIWH
jgi:hypothetical protein